MKFIETTSSQSPILEIIRTEQKVTLKNAHTPKQNIFSFKKQSIKNPREEADNTIIKMLSRAINKAEIQNKINEARKVLSNKNATTEEIDAARDSIDYFYRLVSGIDAVKNNRSKLNQNLSSLRWKLIKKKPSRSAMQQESDQQQLDAFIENLNNVYDLFDNPTVAMLPALEQAQEAAKKALKIVEYGQPQRSRFAPASLFSRDLKKPKDIVMLSNNLNTVSMALRILKGYRNGVYKEKELPDACTQIFNEIRLLLPELSNPNANLTTIATLKEGLKALWYLENALNSISEVKKLREIKPLSFNSIALWLMGKSEPQDTFSSEHAIWQLYKRANAFWDGLELSQGQNIMSVFQEKKHQIADVFNIFENSTIDLAAVKVAEQKVNSLTKLSKAVDAIKNIEESEETEKITRLWERLYAIEQALNKLKGNDFAEYLSGSRHDIVKLVTDIVLAGDVKN